MYLMISIFLCEVDLRTGAETVLVVCLVVSEDRKRLDFIQLFVGGINCISASINYEQNYFYSAITALGFLGLLSRSVLDFAGDLPLTLSVAPLRLNS